MAVTFPSPRPAKGCDGACETCRQARRETDEVDVLHLTPLAIVRSEMLAAVDDLLDTFHARG